MKNGAAILGIMLASCENFSYRDSNNPINIEFRGVSSLTQEEKHIKNGLKRFEYRNGIVYALNQKNANKKAKKLNYI